MKTRYQIPIENSAGSSRLTEEGTNPIFTELLIELQKKNNRMTTKLTEPHPTLSFPSESNGCNGREQP